MKVTAFYVTVLLLPISILCTFSTATTGPCDSYSIKVEPCTNYKRRCILDERNDATKCKDKARQCHDADWKCSVRPDEHKWAMCCAGPRVDTSVHFLQDFDGGCTLTNDTVMDVHLFMCGKGDKTFDDEGTPMPVRMKVEHHDTTNAAVTTDMLGGLTESFDSLCFGMGCSKDSSTLKYQQESPRYVRAMFAGIMKRDTTCTFSYSGHFKSADFKKGAFELLKSEFKRATSYSCSPIPHIPERAGKTCGYTGPTYLKVAVDEDDDDQYLQLDMKCEEPTSRGICDKIGHGLMTAGAAMTTGVYGVFAWTSLDVLCS